MHSGFWTLRIFYKSGEGQEACEPTLTLTESRVFQMMQKALAENAKNRSVASVSKGPVKEPYWQCNACGASTCWQSRVFCFACGVRKGFRPAKTAPSKPSPTPVPAPKGSKVEVPPKKTVHPPSVHPSEEEDQRRGIKTMSLSLGVRRLPIA